MNDIKGLIKRALSFVMAMTMVTTSALAYYDPNGSGDGTGGYLSGTWNTNMYGYRISV